MALSLFQTEDGSLSLKHEELDETYHSKFGAKEESQHIFIRSGLENWLTQNPSASSVRIFEMGFGTGLNTVLTMAFAEQRKLSVYYHSIELYPVSESIYKALKHEALVPPEYRSFVQNIYSSPWNQKQRISPFFELYKEHIALSDFYPENDCFDLIFFDAFSPDKQPDLWTEAVFSKLFKASGKHAVLTTYCSKGDVRRNLSSAGFLVSKIPGPKGKRDITFAQKP